MKTKIILIIFSVISISGFCQQYQKSLCNTKKLEGVWVATSGNKSYEITFVKCTVYERYMKVTLDAVFGSINYLENNVVIKSVNINGFESPLFALCRDEEGEKFDIRYSEFGNSKRINGKVKFDIDADGKTAHWYSLYKTRLIDTENYTPKEDFDIPKELTFTKKPSTKSQSNQPAPHFEFP